MKNPFNSESIVAFIILTIVALIPVLAPLSVAPLVMGLNSYLVIKKTKERGKFLSLFTIFFSLITVCILVAKLFSGPIEQAKALTLYLTASLFLGMFLSNKLKH